VTPAVPSVSGDCVAGGSPGTAVANQIPCGAGGSCSIDDPADNSPQVVAINNDDSISSTLISPDPAPALSLGETIQFSQIQTWTDGCTVNQTASAGWAVTTVNCDDPGSITSGGLYTTGSPSATCTDNVSSSTPAADNSPVSVTVNVAVVCETITINNPDPVNVDEGATVLITATCSYSDSSTDDCTNAGGFSCTTTGDLSEPIECLIQGDQMPCGAGGSGTVTATNVSCTITPSDTNNVNVVNDDVLNSTDITNQPASVSEGATITWKVLENWSDGCTVDVTPAVPSVSGDCVAGGSPGTAVANQIPCGAGGSCSIDDAADNSPQVVAINNDDSLASTDIVNQPASVSEGATITWSVLETWSDGCTVDVTPAVPSVSGDCVAGGSPGTAVANQIPCGAGGSCSIDDAADNSPQAVTVNNDDTITSTVITPGSTTLDEKTSQQFALTRTWSDSCTEDLTLGAGWTVNVSNCTGPDPHGTVSTSGLYTAGDVDGNCQEEVDTTAPAADGPATVSVLCVDGCAGDPPVITTAFPIDSGTFADRFRLNTHVDQQVTVVFDLVGGDAPTSVSLQCVSSSTVDTVNFNCADLSGLPDVPCLPGTNLLGGETYTCTVNASNGNGSDSLVDDIHVGIAAADPEGGFAGGYIGGAYSSSTGVANGTVTIMPVAYDNGDTIGGNVYVQIIQGTTVDEYFTDAGTGQLVASLPPSPIDELTLGYKCGAQKCTEGLASDMYDNYKYMTWYDVDARDLVLPMQHTSSGFFLRDKFTVSGSIPMSDIQTYIRADRSCGNNDTIGCLFRPPVTLRAALVLFNFQSSTEIAAGLDALLFVPDYEISISLCMSWNKRDVDYILPAAIPPNLIAPELIRTTWDAPCNGFSSNPGRTDFLLYNWTPNTYKVAWAVGVYLNGAQFTLDSIDLFSFPMYICAMGWRGVSFGGRGGGAIDIGTDLSFEWDLREDWTSEVVQSDSGPVTLGYNPPDGYDRKVLYTIHGGLPVDPARRDATVRSTWRSDSYKVANLTDSELSGLAPGNWDDRFVRNALIIASGGDMGPGAGIGVTGLALSSKINDREWTKFQQGFLQSTGTQVGNRNLSAFANGTDTETVSIEHAGPASSWGKDFDGYGNSIDFTARIDGGPTNYAVIMAVSRGQYLDTPASNNALDEAPGFTLALDFQPGSIVAVHHVGPYEDATQVEASDWLLLPEALSPPSDQYLYPGPQWMNTVDVTKPANRNSELWRDRSVDSSNAIQTDASDPWNRLYLEMQANPMMLDSGKKLHIWSMKLSEPGMRTMAGHTASPCTGDDPNCWRSKKSAKAKINSTHGYASGYVLQSNHPTEPFGGPDFIEQGVQPGDQVVFNSRRYGYYRTHIVDSVDAYDQLTLTTQVGASIESNGDIRYKIERQAADGGCYIDKWWGGGPTDYSCKANTFWEVVGPLNGATDPTTVRAHIPEVTPGAANLHGVSGVIPDFWDGLPTNVMLEWGIQVTIYNTGSFNEGGIGGPFDYNNQDFKAVDVTITQASSDSVMVLRQ